MRRAVVMLAAGLALGGVSAGLAEASAAAGILAAATGDVTEAAAGPSLLAAGFEGRRLTLQRQRPFRSGPHYGRYGDAHRDLYRRDGRQAIAPSMLDRSIGAMVGEVQPDPGYGGVSRHSYCASKYRSYDPRTGTFLGYDGQRHPCR